jgi:hypothetical protein
MSRVVHASLTAVLVFSLAASASAQDSKSAALAKQLASALDAAKLDSLAAADPTNPGSFVAALYFANMQLLVVSGKYSAPTLLVDRIAKKDYREVYLDLNGATSPDSKMFVEDIGADGLKARRDDNQPFDSVDLAGKRTSFNSDWKAQKLSEQDYMKAFATADEEYAKMLTTLLAQVKKTS